MYVFGGKSARVREDQVQNVCTCGREESIWMCECVNVWMCECVNV